MEQDLKNKIEARFAELPEDIQKAVKSADVDKKIHEISTKHQLHIDQAGALGDEVLLAMLGFTDMADFADNIAEHLNLPADKAETIAQDIGTVLFIPIRESMQEFMEQRALHETLLAEKTEATKQPPMPTTIAPILTKPANLHPADAMLSQKTVTTAPLPAPKLPIAAVSTAPTPTNPIAALKVEPTAPQPYKADPYREPTT